MLHGLQAVHSKVKTQNLKLVLLGPLKYSKVALGCVARV
jgi:hypothetical protein